MNCKSFAPSVDRLIDLSLRRERPTFTEEDFKSERSRVNDLNDKQAGVLMRAIARFTVGERIVENQLTPLIDFYNRDNTDGAARVRALFIKIQQAEEKIHADFFADYVQHVFGNSGDEAQDRRRIQELKDKYFNTDDPFSRPFKNLFEGRLPRVLARLSAPQRWLPAAFRETAALVCYHIFAEGVVAESAYFGFQKALTRPAANPGNQPHELLPITLKGIAMIKADESTHIAFGILRLRELIAGDSTTKASWTRGIMMRGLFVMNCLANMPSVIGIVGAVHREHPGKFPFELDRQQLAREGVKQFWSRLKAVLFGPKS
jgi:ribonucleoside-diphosphate reductase beta chain